MDFDNEFPIKCCEDRQTGRGIINDVSLCMIHGQMMSEGMPLVASVKEKDVLVTSNSSSLTQPVGTSAHGDHRLPAPRWHKPKIKSQQLFSACF